MLVRHLCLLCVFLMSETCVFACLGNVRCIVGSVRWELPLFETSPCAHFSRYTLVCLFLFDCLLYAPWAQLRRGALRPDYYYHYYY